MSYVVAASDLLASTATELARIDAALNTANAAAVLPTTVLQAAGADEVSAAVAALFSSHARAYQALSVQAGQFHQWFTQTLSGAGLAYASAEAANVSPLQVLERDVLGLVNAPAQALLGRPIIGNGADGAPGSGANGADGGILIGNGGTGGSGAPGQNGGAGGNAGLLGSGGTGGVGGAGATGGTGGTGGLLWGNGGIGGQGGTAMAGVNGGSPGHGGNGGNAFLFGDGGTGGAGWDRPGRGRRCQPHPHRDGRNRCRRRQR